ncbi:MAG: hypothetical protein WCQ47_08555, partial [bacterium]
MNKTKKTILMGLIGLVFSGVLNAQTSTNTSVEKHLDEIDARLTSTMLSYNSQEFSQTFVKKELASIDELVLRVNEQISGLPKSAIVLAYLDELEADAVKLQKLKRANSKTAVNTLYTADCFKNNLIAIEKKSVLEEMNNRGLLDETFKKVPKQLNNFVTWEELDQIAEILATKLVEKGLTLESGKLPALIEREIFTDLDAKNSEARAILDQKTVNKPDINAKRALGRIARRTLDALSFYFILNAAYQHGGIHAFHSATHGVAEVGTTIVLANVVLHVLDGYWTYKGKNRDIKKMLSVSFNNAKNMEWTKRLAQNFGESYKALTMSSNKKSAKKQVDKVMFSLLFAEKTGGTFYNQALENAIYEISEAHSPITN